MVAEIERARPDLVLLQVSPPTVDMAVALALPGFESRSSTQFFMASRYPIVAFHEPAGIGGRGIVRSPRFVRATLDTPLGLLDVFDIHPISPREALESVRGQGLYTELRNGSVLRGDSRMMVENTELRRSQAEAIAALAAASQNPVIIAGDTNLPGPSRILAQTLGRWQDGFSAVGRGFGYTFPVGRHFAWMRIDRIMSGPELRFLTFGVGEGRNSDHRHVWADIERPGASGRTARK